VGSVPTSAPLSRRFWALGAKRPAALLQINFNSLPGRCVTASWPGMRNRSTGWLQCRLPVVGGRQGLRPFVVSLMALPAQQKNLVRRRTAVGPSLDLTVLSIFRTTSAGGSGASHTAVRLRQLSRQHPPPPRADNSAPQAAVPPEGLHPDGSRPPAADRPEQRPTSRSASASPRARLLARLVPAPRNRCQGSALGPTHQREVAMGRAVAAMRTPYGRRAASEGNPARQCRPGRGPAPSSS
jgi:hypothetical protein